LLKLAEKKKKTSAQTARSVARQFIPFTGIKPAWVKDKS